MGGFDMNRYDEKYAFRLADISDVPEIMDFINNEWKKGHILGTDREFFLWQYGNTEYGDYNNINVVIMHDKETNKIVGINCFVKYSNNRDRMFVSSSITKVSAGITIPMSGVELIRRFRNLVPAKAYFSSGTNPKTLLPLGKKFFGYHTGVMQQYYILNMEIKDFYIAKISHPIMVPHASGNCSLIEIHNLMETVGRFDFERCYEGLPFKSEEFIQKRYFQHPVYQYKKWMIENKEKQIEGILFGREIIRGQTKALRLVDYRGNINALSELGNALNTILTEEHYEYIDLMASKLSEEMLRKSGFILLDVEGENVIPNYFEPYVQENIKVYFHESDDNIIILKADGDQDRPNALKNIENSPSVNN